MMCVEDKRPEIPDYVFPDVAKLITDCWAFDDDDRPTFDQIFGRLDEMQFRLMPGVNSSKVSKFVEKRGTQAKVFWKRSTSLCSLQNAHISADSTADPEKSKLQTTLAFERSLQFSNPPLQERLPIEPFLVKERSNHE
jgi:hypothetical protein